MRFTFAWSYKFKEVRALQRDGSTKNEKQNNLLASDEYPYDIRIV